MAWMWGKKKGPLGGGSIVTQLIDKTIYNALNPKPSDEQLKAEADLAKGPAESVKQPDVSDPNVMDATARQAARARKRRGAASTLLSTDTEVTGSTSQMLGGSF